MKTVLKLIIALALLNAVARGAWAQWNYYELKDTAQQLLTFGADSSPEQIQGEIVQRASELNIPLDADDVQVDRNGLRSTAKVSYTQPEEFFPSYTYPMKFDFIVDTIAIRAGTKGSTRK
jgi:hypothetical protein